MTHWLRVEAPKASEYTEFPLGGNYWGTTNERAIGLQILDYMDFPDTYALLLKQDDPLSYGVFYKDDSQNPVLRRFLSLISA